MASPAEPPHQKYRHHANPGEHLTFGPRIERIGGDFELETQTGPSAPVIQLVVHAGLKVMGIDRFQFIALPGRKRARQCGQPVPGIHGPVDKLDGETSIVRGRPHRHQQ